jgi:hypothetical protein
MYIVFFSYRMTHSIEQLYVDSVSNGRECALWGTRLTGKDHTGLRIRLNVFNVCDSNYPRNLVKSMSSESGYVIYCLMQMRPQFSNKVIIATVLIGRPLGRSAMMFLLNDCEDIYTSSICTLLRYSV